MKKISDSFSPNEQINNDLSKSSLSANPLAQSLNFTVSIPETIEVKMVDASILADYEIWFFISSILASAVMGFLVAFFQDTTKLILLYNDIVFLLLFIVAVVFAITKRNKLRNKSKTFKLIATEIAE